jgi:hypothetical protein
MPLVSWCPCSNCRSLNELRRAVDLAWGLLVNCLSDTELELVSGAVFEIGIRESSCSSHGQ